MVFYMADCIRLHRSYLSSLDEMVIPPPDRPPSITKFLTPYVMKMHFTNKYVTAQVIHSPTATVDSSASSRGKTLRSSMGTKQEGVEVAMIGKLLGERLQLKEIPPFLFF